MPTSQIIVTSRYIKSDTKKSKTKRVTFTKHIATRESVPISRSEFQQIRENPLRDIGVVKTYRDLMYSDKDGSHCIMLHIPIPKTKTDKISP